MDSLRKHSDGDRETNQQRRQVLSLASPFSLAPGTVRVLEPREGASARLVEQLCRGEVTGPFMLDSAGMRHLYFDLQAVQSSMRGLAPLAVGSLALTLAACATPGIDSTASAADLQAKADYHAMMAADYRARARVDEKHAIQWQVQANLGPS